MHPKSSKALCSNCAGAADIVQQVLSMRNNSPFDAERVVDNMPTLLESAVGYLLSEFDYQAKMESNTAIAIRIVAACTAQAQSLQAYCEHLLQMVPVAKVKKRPLA